MQIIKIGLEKGITCDFLIMLFTVLPREGWAWSSFFAPIFIGTKKSGNRQPDLKLLRLPLLFGRQSKLRTRPK